MLSSRSVVRELKDAMHAMTPPTVIIQRWITHNLAFKARLLEEGHMTPELLRQLDIQHQIFIKALWFPHKVSNLVPAYRAGIFEKPRSIGKRIGELSRGEPYWLLGGISDFYYVQTDTGLRGWGNKTLIGPPVYVDLSARVGGLQGTADQSGVELSGRG